MFILICDHQEKGKKQQQWKEQQIHWLYIYEQCWSILQLRTPAVGMIFVISEAGLATKLDALA